MPWAIPPGALPEWLEMAAAIDAAGTVPCRTGDHRPGVPLIACGPPGR